MNVELLSYAIAFLFASAAWHYVYEKLVAPVARFHLRNELFALRDQVRHEIMARNFDPVEENGIVFVHDAVTRFINRLPYLNLGILIQANILFKENTELDEEADNRTCAIEKVSNKKVLAAFLRTDRIIYKAILWNSGSGIIYILPSLILHIAFRSAAKVLSKKILSMPPGGTRELIPNYSG